MSCNCCGAEMLFDIKTARKEFKKYNRKGPNKATQMLIESFDSNEMSGMSLLDIGGGIGAIQWSFLQNGATKTTDVDYSDGYIQVAREFASSKNWSEQTNFHQGDFLDLTETIERHDVVTLDKVVCCYPDYVGLLNSALDKSNHSIGLVYPFGGLIAKVFAFFGRVAMRLSGNSFRPYIHPVKEIRALIMSRGFEAVSMKRSLPWHVEVYRKVV